ncbi:hypothetical protein [Streptomyces doebereineriae]|uniref:Lipoprotein n=1 Tax=Streptomyces doebereineriae TaxID=3075528 RepID=A0ABU2VAR1_9ACTN|nr:hypothetical protein [Streptomyces sp. DSM 41640]MDT0482621.1 hypothetical protein [Streptomyces sp. DSM 41640]
MANLTRARVAAVIVLAVSVPLVAGCTTHDSQTSSQNVPNASPTPSHPTPPIDVTRTPPDISGSTKTFVRLADRTGSEEVTVIPSIKAGTIAVATECAGEGKTIIMVGKLTTYTIPCTTTPSTTYNEIGLGSSKQHVLITVTAGAGIHWGLSVGWRPGHERPS